MQRTRYVMPTEVMKEKHKDKKKHTPGVKPLAKTVPR